MPHNLEKHPTLPNRWIAYDATGLAFRVTRDSKTGECTAHPSHARSATDRRAIRAYGLSRLAALIAASRPA